MELTTVLFDLDGTLLAMDLEEYMDGYLEILTDSMKPYGYEPEELKANIWKGIYAIINQGGSLNSQRFWSCVEEIYGKEKIEADRPIFEDFYDNGQFDKAAKFCGRIDYAPEIVKELKAKGLKLVLATCPVYPIPATLARMRWAGLDPEDFTLITHYDNMHYTKPAPEYYAEILEVLDLKPEECLMVGNDTADDLPAEKCGIPCFITEECLRNFDNIDYSDRPHGTLRDLKKYIDERLGN